LSRIGWLRLLLIVAAVAALEIACRAGWIDRFTMIPPSEMALALYAMAREGAIWPDVEFTLINMLAAVALSILLGFFAGALLHGLPRLRRVVAPLLAAYYAVPTFIFYPVFIVLLGLNRLPLIAIGTVLGVVGMMVSTLDGLDRIPPVLLKTATCYRMGPLARALLVKLPAAAPQLLTGVKLAVIYANIGVLAGEFILAVAGIGRRLAIAYNDLDNATMYGLLLLVLGFVTLVNLGLDRAERRLHRRWGRA
jgi:NitT/TauT family transport system permease protein